jgi:hypothetical protein
MDIEMMEYWEPALMKEPELPEGAATLALLENEQTGALDVVLLGPGDGTVMATIYEGPGGWHATSNGLYLTAGPKRSIDGALKAAIGDERMVRYLVAELMGTLDDEPTQKLEVRCG